MLKTLLKKSKFFLCVITALFFYCHAYSMQHMAEHISNTNFFGSNIHFSFNEAGDLECFDKYGAKVFQLKETSDGKLLEKLKTIINSEWLLRDLGLMKKNQNKQVTIHHYMPKKVLLLIPTIFYAECPTLDPEYTSNENPIVHRMRLYKKFSQGINGDANIATAMHGACEALGLRVDIQKRVEIAARKSLGTIATLEFNKNIALHTKNNQPTIEYIKRNLAKGPDEYFVPLALQMKYRKELFSCQEFKTYIQHFEKNPHHPVLKLFDDELILAIHLYKNSFFGTKPQAPDWYKNIIKHAIKNNPSYCPPGWFYALQKMDAETTIKKASLTASILAYLGLHITGSQNTLPSFLPFIATAASTVSTSLYNNSISNPDNADSSFNAHLKQLEHTRIKTTIMENDAARTDIYKSAKYPCLSSICQEFFVHSMLRIGTNTAGLLLTPKNYFSNAPTFWFQSLALGIGCTGSLLINSNESNCWHFFDNCATPAAHNYFKTKALFNEVYKSKNSELAAALKLLFFDLEVMPRSANSYDDYNLIKEINRSIPELSFIQESVIHKILTVSNLSRLNNPTTKRTKVWGLTINDNNLQLPVNPAYDKNHQLIETPITHDVKKYILKFIYPIDPLTKTMAITPTIYHCPIPHNDTNQSNDSSIPVSLQPFSALQKKLFLEGWNIGDIYEYTLKRQYNC